MPSVGHEASATSGSSVAHTTTAENVVVQSVVSSEVQSKVNMENTQKVAALMSKLGTTHQQVDEYSRRRTEQISEEVSAAIARIVGETQVEQSTLLADASVRSQIIEDEYTHNLQRYVQEIDTSKAQTLSELEHDLNSRQEMILEQAKRRIDDLNEEANRLKMGVLREAQAQADANVGAITGQIAALGAEDANRLLTSTSTTVITTEARTAGETHGAATAAAVVTGVTATTAQSSMTQSSVSHAARN